MSEDSNFGKWLSGHKVSVFFFFIIVFCLIIYWIPNRPAFLNVKSDTIILQAGQDTLKRIMIAEFRKINERLDIYDKDLQRIPKIFPQPGAKISSTYGESRDSVKHWGLDISNKKGSPIYAAVSGIVVSAKYDDGYGNRTILDSGVFKVAVSHQDEMYVVQGQIVKQGQLIGTVGSTGISTGPHEHIEIEQDGKRRNPIVFYQ